MHELEAHAVSNIFPLLEGDEFDALVANITVNGLREPIWLHPVDARIVDGRNRYRACQVAGIEPRTRVWDGEGSLIEFVLSLNLHRRHLTASQKACVALNILPLLEEEARVRMLVGRPKEGVEKFPQDIGKARDKTAKAVGANPRYVSDAKKLKEQEPELYERVRSGGITLQEAKQEIKKERKAEAVKRIIQEAGNFPAGPIRVIVIDPPWKYTNRAEDPTHRGRCPYPDMSLEEIKALPIAKLAHADSILWLWTTNAFMREAFECLDSWGFTNKTILTWGKDRMGLGDWLRGQTEHCLMAVRGKPVVTLSNQTTLLTAPVREHSRKPDEFYALVESLCPGAKLELFAREARPGWQSWGAETESFAAVSARPDSGLEVA